MEQTKFKGVEIKIQNLTKVFDENKKKGTHGTIAVNDFTITIPAGKLVGLLGPSGCGKSTTLYMISGLLKPTSGKIYFIDDDVTDLTPESREIGLVFQNYALYPHMTVRQNILFPLVNMKVKQRMIKEAKEPLKKLLLEKKIAIIAAKEAGKSSEEIQVIDQEYQAKINDLMPSVNENIAKAKAHNEIQCRMVAKLVAIEDQLDKKPGQLSGGQQPRVAIARALVKHPHVFLLDVPLSNLAA
jgi:multiple sugar transport system ATP-binding protein